MSQAATTNLSGIPNDLLIILNPLAYIILAPIYAHAIYPTIERFGLRFGHIKRITTGFLLSTIAMGIAAVVQYYVYATNPCGTQSNTCIALGQHSSLSVWVQLPIYFLIANSEILALTTSMEYLYSHAPKNLKSISMALIGLTSAAGAAFGQMLVPLSEDPYLVWNYIAAGALSLIASVGLYWCHRGRDKEGQEGDDVARVVCLGTQAESNKETGEVRQ
jgi:POT family proton-dependent oligopeptide transporter